MRATNSCTVGPKILGAAKQNLVIRAVWHSGSVFLVQPVRFRVLFVVYSPWAVAGMAA